MSEMQPEYINKLFGVVRNALDDRAEKIDGIRKLEEIAIQFNIRRTEYNDKYRALEAENERLNEENKSLKLQIGLLPNGKVYSRRQLEKENERLRAALQSIASGKNVCNGVFSRDIAREALEELGEHPIFSEIPYDASDLMIAGCDEMFEDLQKDLGQK